MKQLFFCLVLLLTSLCCSINLKGSIKQLNPSQLHEKDIVRIKDDFNLLEVANDLINAKDEHELYQMIVNKRKKLDLNLLQVEESMSWRLLVKPCIHEDGPEVVVGNEEYPLQDDLDYIIKLRKLIADNVNEQFIINANITASENNMTLADECYRSNSAEAIILQKMAIAIRKKGPLTIPTPPGLNDTHVYKNRTIPYYSSVEGLARRFDNQAKKLPFEGLFAIDDDVSEVDTTIKTIVNPLYFIYMRESKEDKHKAVLCHEVYLSIEKEWLPMMQNEITNLQVQLISLCSRLRSALLSLQIKQAQNILKIPDKFDMTMPSTCPAPGTPSTVGGAGGDLANSTNGSSSSNNSNNGNLNGNTGSSNGGNSGSSGGTQTNDPYNDNEPISTVGCSDKVCWMEILKKKSYAYNKAAGAALYLKYTTTRDVAQSLSVQFAIDIDKFIRYYMAWRNIQSITQCNGEAKIHDRYVSGRIDDICKAEPVEERDHCNRENYKVSKDFHNKEDCLNRETKTVIFGTNWRFLLGGCRDPLEKIRESTDILVKAAKESPNTMFNQFIDGVRKWINFWVDSEKYRAQAQNLLNQMHLPPPPNISRDSFIFMFQQLIKAKKYALHGEQAKANIAKIEWLNLKSTSSDSEALAKVQEKYDLANGDVENAMDDLKNTEFQYAQFVKVKNGVPKPTTEAPEVVGPAVLCTLGYNNELYLCNYDQMKSLNQVDCDAMKSLRRKKEIMESIQLLAKTTLQEGDNWYGKLVAVAISAAQDVSLPPLYFP